MARTTRRSFVRTLGIGGATLLAAEFITARGREALGAESQLRRWQLSRPLLRLDSNENPNGPAAAAIEAMTDALSEASRYPDAAEEELRAAIARTQRVRPEEVLLGCGSGEVLRYVTESFTAPGRPLVTAAPTFETPALVARRIGALVREVRVSERLQLDLEGMLRAAQGAGLVFFCNPNNPTGTAHGAEATERFIEAVLERSPETAVLVDEAYFEYVELPGYRTMIPLAVRRPGVIVARTFSKVYGLAGMRVGYAVAHQDTIARLAPLRLASGVNVLAAVAARTSLELRDHVAREVARNKAARDYTVKFFNGLGFPCQVTHTNFVMVDIRRDIKAFQALCRERGVAVGRPFPPLETYLRLSIGTMDEMQKALPIIAAALRDSRPVRGQEPR
jgi:histidinol-phosphate aminotransferase